MEQLRCSHCNFKARSGAALLAHLRARHPERMAQVGEALLGLAQLLAATEPGATQAEGIGEEMRMAA